MTEVSNLLALLREDIESKHREALSALAVLEKYMADSGAAKGRIVVHGNRWKATIRAKVTEAASDWSTVSQIVEKTGLSRSQVNGVFGNTTHRGYSIFEKRTSDNGMEYRVRPVASEPHVNGDVANTEA